MPVYQSFCETPGLMSVWLKYKCLMRMFNWDSDLHWSDFPQEVVVKGSIKGKSWREFPGGPVVRAWHFYFRGQSSVCGCRTKILQAALHGHKKQKQINEELACGGENSEMRAQHVQRPGVGEEGPRWEQVSARGAWYLVRLQTADRQV